MTSETVEYKGMRACPVHLQFCSGLLIVYLSVLQITQYTESKPEGSENMTVKEFADGLGLTKGAVYKAIRNSSFTLDQITGRSGQITEEGRKILQILFPDQEPLSEPLKETQPEDSALDDLRERLREAERARDKAEESLRIEKEQRTLFERLYNETRDDLRKLQESSERERAAMHDRISEANRLLSQQQELERLRTMNPIKRLFAGRKKEKPAQTVDGSGQVN